MPSEKEFMRQYPSTRSRVTEATYPPELTDKLCLAEVIKFVCQEGLLISSPGALQFDNQSAVKNKEKTSKLVVPEQSKCTRRVSLPIFS